jgi:hypothetical protein
MASESIKPVRCRFYMVKQVYNQVPIKESDELSYVINRPTHWGVFLKTCLCWMSCFCLVSYGFVRIPISKADSLFEGDKVGILDETKVRINGDIYYIERWSFLNLCFFCIEGLRYGTLLNIFQWRF